MAEKEVCGSDEEDFGLIRPSIIKCLRGILQQYPENGQILKEIVQNAEDAGANKVRFLVDWNTYGQDEAQMEHPGLKHFQGPALYSYNDAHFTAVDWKSLQLLQDSLKAKDIMKIGRFGLGFKSVYHLTELPSVLSGNFLGYFDPSETFFSKDGDLSTGKRYKFTKSPEIIRKFRHQFEPFDGKYSCKIDQLHITGFDGTLFRFPLRQEPTKLSESIHTEISMKRLYDSFISDAHSMLLFLHNVEDIELWSLAKGQSEPSLYYKVVASPDHRMKAVSNGRTRIVQSDQQTVVFPLEITTEQGCKKRTTHWLVSEVLGSTSILEKYKHQAIPVIGVAMPSLMQDTATTALKGQLFCYVPLSAPEDGSEVTGLPVHVNGTFSLSPDRHHIITPTAGQSWKTNSDLAWNDLLRSHLLPIAYRNLILEAVRLHSEFPDDIPIGMVMSAWPNQMKVRSEWQQMATEVMKELSMKYDVFHSDYEGGCWVGSSSAVLEDLSCDKSMQEILKKVALKCHLKISPRFVCPTPDFMADNVNNADPVPAPAEQRMPVDVPMNEGTEEVAPPPLQADPPAAPRAAAAVPDPPTPAIQAPEPPANVNVAEIALPSWRQTRNLRCKAHRAEQQSALLNDFSRQNTLPRWSLNLEAIPAAFLPTDLLQSQYATYIRRQAKARLDFMATLLTDYSRTSFTQADAYRRTVVNLYEGANGLTDALNLLDHLYDQDKGRNIASVTSRRTRVLAATDADILAAHLRQPDSYGPRRTNASATGPSTGGARARSRSRSPLRQGNDNRRPRSPSASGSRPRTQGQRPPRPSNRAPQVQQQQRQRRPQPQMLSRAEEAALRIFRENVRAGYRGNNPVTREQ